MDVLRDKQYKNYNYFSRYTSIPYYYHTEDKRYVYGTASAIKKDIIYALHEVKNSETYDSIALDYYNNPTYF